ncbi:P-loop containing nucleoside triphosphate hydrolase protein [Globomyces pollinis-pini]|nr:P-loop containing nucleoside triphosphate hydrolase protein [Globomyces pollinis-pini]
MTTKTDSFTVYKESKQSPISPAVNAGVWGSWTYSWLNTIIKLGRARPLEETDLFSLPDEKKSQKLVDELEAEWNKEKQKQNPSLYTTIKNVYLRKIAPIGILRFISDMGTNFAPILIQYLLLFQAESQSQAAAGKEMPSFYYGLSYAIGIFAIQFYITVIQNKFFQLSLGAGLSVKTAFIGLIFRKSTKLSAAARQNFNSGKVTNLVSTDTARIEQFINMGHVLWTAPIQFSIITTLLILLLGPAALAGIVLLIVLMPLQKVLMGKLQAVRKEIAPVSDSRVKLIQEIISGIRVIKFFTWEDPFVKQVETIRAKEVQLVRKRSYVQAFVMAIVFAIPVFSAASALVIYGATNPLDPSRIFSALALFNQLRFPLMFIPMSIVSYAEFSVAIKRVQELLLAGELDEQPVADPSQTDAIVINDGEFHWEVTPGDNESKEMEQKMKKSESKKFLIKDSEIELTEGPSTNVKEKSTLTDINIRIPKGSLVAIVGTVGSGKSSLLNSLIGETKRISGDISFSGNIGYAPQQAWIQNATIKENILFGLPYIEDKYLRTIRACALEKDLELLADGDQTEIGERGINLSGGQKQRINLARLLYFGSDIVLLDDPLSAVDAHVGRHLFEKCIRTAMNGKTRLLVTHQLHFLPQVDFILVMKNGKIAEQGSYDSLINDNGEFATLMKDYGGTDDIADDDDNILDRRSSVDSLTRIKKGIEDKSEKTKNKLMENEDRAVGTVKKDVWLEYFNAAGGWTFLMLLVLVLILQEGARVGTDAWLVVWTRNSIPSLTTYWYIIIYFSWGIVQAITTYLVGVLFAYFGTGAAKSLHERAFTRIVRAPQSFFDSTPLGRIINRFSKDQDGIDSALIDAFRMFLSMLSTTISSFILISFATPAFLLTVLPISVLYYLIQSYYRSISREVKRLEALARSPLYAQLGETLDGIPTIRAYREQQRFINMNESRLDQCNSPSYLMIDLARWMSIRLESLGAVIVFFSAFFGILNREFLSPALFGLVLSYALQVTGTLNWTIRQFTETEIAMNAVERVSHYGHSLPQEAEAITNVRPSAEWPSKGDIEFKNISMRYKEGLPLVLQDISLKISPNEKIGIVGRTGSGKSSIMQVLFRMVEPSTGDIIIDGMNIKELGLKDLRAGLGIIPQDPVLFSGTFRRNLDPFNSYTDNDIWNALEKANIKEKVVETGGLEGLIQEGGENLSVGQRQLLCLARALLASPKILVMDEATANVDFETDAIIQKCIRSDLKDSTILTIAHRLNTIMDYDRVLVLDHGRIMEFDSPKILIGKENGVFRAMAEETGAENMQVFLKMFQ